MESDGHHTIQYFDDWLITWRHHAVGVGCGWQAVAAAGMVHEDGQRRVEGEGGEGVGAESLAGHGALGVAPPAGRIWTCSAAVLSPRLA